MVCCHKPSCVQVTDCPDQEELDKAAPPERQPTTPVKILMRDSKTPDGPVLGYTEEEFWAFILGVKAGEFDDMVSPEARQRVEESNAEVEKV
jgi:hypothetical protein